MATVYTEADAQVYALQARTDAAGGAVDDVTGEDLRVVMELWIPGVVMAPADAWQVRQRGAGANMSVDVGSGDPDVDKAIVAGTDAGQGHYLVRRVLATVNVTVPAANLSNPRVDELYLVVQDNAYDGSGRVLARLAYRDGTPAGSPVAPGPDAAWNAYLLLATISVPAGDTTIEDAQITDGRVATTVLPATVADHAATHVSGGSDDLAGLVAGFIQMGAESESLGSTISESAYTTHKSVTFTKPASWNTYQIMVIGHLTAHFIGTGSGDMFNQWAAQLSIAGVVGGGVNGQVDTKVTNSYGAEQLSRHVAFSRTGLTGNATILLQSRSFVLASFSGIIDTAALMWVAVRTS